jgi:integrase
VGANRRRVKLGEVGVLKLADARTKARTILAEKQLGRHLPLGSTTYQEALETFLKVAAGKNKPRTVKDYTRLLTRHGFGLEKLGDIQPRSIQANLDNLPPGERAHAYAALSIFFRWCVRRNLVDRNPLERVEKPANRRSRDRVLDDDELKAIWSACRGMFGDIVKLCVLTGQRRSEIAQLQRDWIKGDLITFPRDATKNKREHTFPVGTLAQQIIEAQPHRNDTPYLFPARNWGRGKKAAFYASWGRDKAALDRACGVSQWVIHDLRRTLASSWQRLGIPIEVTETYLNHRSGTFAGIVSVYQRHTYLDEMRGAVSRWEAKLAGLIGQKADPTRLRNDVASIDLAADGQFCR